MSLEALAGAAGDALNSNDWWGDQIATLFRFRDAIALFPFVSRRLTPKTLERPPSARRWVVVLLLYSRPPSWAPVAFEAVKQVHSEGLEPPTLGSEDQAH